MHGQSTTTTPLQCKSRALQLIDQNGVGFELDLTKAHDTSPLNQRLWQGLATEIELDTVVGRSLSLLMRTGLFDPIEDQIYTKIGVEQLGAPEHHVLAEEVAAQVKMMT